jgi:hypothetical protein
MTTIAERLPRGFLLGGEFLDMFSSWRVLWLRGRFGGGKTSLAFILATWVWWQGLVDNIYSNIRSPLCGVPQLPLHSAALVLDEAWQILTSAKAVEDYAAFVRHLNLYLLLPSVYPPHPRLRFLSAQRVFDARFCGIPLWVYRWSLGSGAVREHGYFAFWNPAAIYPYYAQGIAGGDGGLGLALRVTHAYYRQVSDQFQTAIEAEVQRQAEALLHGQGGRAALRQYEAKSRGGGKFTIDTSEAETVFADAAADIADAADRLKRRR